MKNTILLLILSLSLTTYSQDIEKMDKKELRIALKISNVSKDSVISINNDKDKELTKLNQNLIIFKDSIKAQKAKIASSLLLKKQSEDNSKILTKTVAVLKDSIQELKLKIPFIVSSFTIKALPKNCCMVYSETKELYKAKEYICFWGESADDNSLNLYIDNKKIKINRIDSDDETDDYQYKNDKYLVKIRKRKSIYENDIILIIESAELLIRNLDTDQEIIKKVYGEGGC